MQDKVITKEILTTKCNKYIIDLEKEKLQKMIINKHLSIVDDGEKKLIINNDNGIIIQLTKHLYQKQK